MLTDEDSGPHEEDSEPTVHGLVVENVERSFAEGTERRKGKVEESQHASSGVRPPSPSEFDSPST